jgi:hypothetical protein
MTAALHPPRHGHHAVTSPNPNNAASRSLSLGARSAATAPSIHSNLATRYRRRHGHPSPAPGCSHHMSTPPIWSAEDEPTSSPRFSPQGSWTVTKGRDGSPQTNARTGGVSFRGRTEGQPRVPTRDAGLAAGPRRRNRDSRARGATSRRGPCGVPGSGPRNQQSPLRRPIRRRQ